MAKIIDDVKARIAESEGFPVEKIDEFVAFIQDEPYITSAGLQFKMLQTYGAGKFAVQSVMPSRDEYALLRSMMGLKDEDPLVVMRGEVWVEGFERPFVDYGTTSPKNLRGFVRFSDYPLEMATRRATNRAMRLATATGLCSVDEIKEPSGEPQKEEACTQGQIDLIRNLGRNIMITDDERARIESQVAEGLSKRQASELIDRIKIKLDARKNSKQTTSAIEELELLAKSEYVTDDERLKIEKALGDGLTDEEADKKLIATKNIIAKRKEEAEAQAEKDAEPQPA